MTVPHWIAYVAAALFLTAAVALGLLWSQGALRHPSEDARPGGEPPACAPLNPGGPPPAECPQARIPARRTP